MKELETILKKENYDFKVIEQISDGETSRGELGIHQVQIRQDQFLIQKILLKTLRHMKSKFLKY